MDDQLSPQQNEEFMRLYASHQRELYSYLSVFLREPADVDEVLQETSIVLWRKFVSFDPQRSSFLAWAHGVAHYELLKYCSARKRAMLPLNEEAVAAISSERESMEAQLDLRRDALRTCLRQLHDTDRELVQRCYAPRVKMRSVAEQIGRPINSVYKSLGRIRRALAGCIERRLARENV